MIELDCILVKVVILLIDIVWSFPKIQVFISFGLNCCQILIPFTIQVVNFFTPWVYLPIDAVIFFWPKWALFEIYNSLCIVLFADNLYFSTYFNIHLSHYNTWDSTGTFIENILIVVGLKDDPSLGFWNKFNGCACKWNFWSTIVDKLVFIRFNVHSWNGRMMGYLFR